MLKLHAGSLDSLAVKTMFDQTLQAKCLPRTTGYEPVLREACFTWPERGRLEKGKVSRVTLTAASPDKRIPGVEELKLLQGLGIRSLRWGAWRDLVCG